MTLMLQLVGMEGPRFGLGEFVIAEQFQNIFEGRDIGLDGCNVLFSEDAAADPTHCGDCGAHRVIGPNDRRDPGSDTRRLVSDNISSEQSRRATCFAKHLE